MDYDYDTVYTSKTGQVITIVSASISTISSFLILYVILRSRNGFTSPSPYHQIMLSVGFWDIISSLSMALTTAPMPSDGMTKDFYNFAGKTYGNTATCDAQGFLYLLGASFSIASCCSLYTYFTATIRFGMKEENVKRRLLPIFFILSCFVSIPFPVYFLFKGNINPNPLDPLCSANTFPIGCVSGSVSGSVNPKGDDNNNGNDSFFEDEDTFDINDHHSSRQECLRGDQGTLVVAMHFLTSGLVLAGLSTFVNMGLIFHRVFQNTLSMKKSLIKSNDLKKRRRNLIISGVGAGAGAGDDESSTNHSTREGEDASSDVAQQHLEEEEEQHQLAKLLRLQNIILIQASMYIGAFLLCYTIPIINLIIDYTGRDSSSNYLRAILRLVLQPLQGFFNALIFVANKAYDYKQAKDADWLEAFLAVFKTPKEVPEMHFSNVSQVQMDQDVDYIGPDGMNLGNNNNNNNNNAPMDGARHGSGAGTGTGGNSTPRARIIGKGMDFGEECVSWNDISSNNSNGVNSAANSDSNSNSMPSRSNSRSLGGLSGFSFSQQSQSQSRSQCQSNYAEGLSLGPSRSPSSPSRTRGSDEYEDNENENEHRMQMSDYENWAGDDGGLSYA